MKAVLILQKRIDARLKLQGELRNNDDLSANGSAIAALNDALHEIDPASSYDLEYHGYTVSHAK